MGQPTLPTIVVVEDEKATRMSLVSMLDSEGFKVLGAEDGADALRIIKSMKVDLILSDIQMPVMDGIALYEKVQEDPKLRHIPFIFLTSLAGQEQKMAGRALGVDEYVTKPFEKDLLLASLRGKLKRAGMIQASRDQEIEELKREVLKSLSNEVRIPVNIIRNLSTLLLDEKIAVSQQQLKDLLKSMKAGGDRLQRGLDDFVMCLQIEAGVMRQQHESEKGPQDLLSILNKIIPQSSSLAKPRNMKVVWNPPDGSLSVVGMGKQLEYLLERLVYGSLALSNTGTEVEVTTEVGEREVIVAVRNGSTVISKTDLPHLFEKQAQIRQPSPDEFPVGLALYNAKRLAEINNCNLTCASQPGSGTRFTLVAARTHARHPVA